MKLYGYWRSSSAWRVRIVLNIKGIDYDYAPVNIAPKVREQITSSFAEVNPLQQVPTLEWDEAGATVRLTQSVAIVEYLETFKPEPPLLPRAPTARARVREAVEIVNSGIQPLQSTYVLNEARRLLSAEEANKWPGRAIQPGLRALEVHAERYAGFYSVGDELSLADAYLVPQLYNARRYGLDLSHFPRLIAVENHLNELDAFAKARPELQPDAVHDQ
ncbi:MAG TPA: maleylacetoacetate isomerase [Polyangiales bacterium]|nr:maleylacetoacetate isomerase [Polyangiales bacterium]